MRVEADLGRRVGRGGRGSRGGGLWVLAALVTTVLNLDAAVVLLTPLYVSIARRSGRDPLALAFQPVLLASLASSALPVSNLTNLIAASATGATTGGFVAHLALPSLVATATTAQSLALVEREALLQEAVFALDGFSRILADTPEMVAARALLRRRGSFSRWRKSSTPRAASNASAGKTWMK